jgi:hypothetical protein
MRCRTPEMLDSDVIVRRFLQLLDRDTDMGAMFVCHMVWRQHEREGDGTVTLAVPFQSIFNQGVTCLAASRRNSTATASTSLDGPPGNIVGLQARRSAPGWDGGSRPPSLA